MTIIWKNVLINFFTWIIPVSFTSGFYHHKFPRPHYNHASSGGDDLSTVHYSKQLNSPANNIIYHQRFNSLISSVSISYSYSTRLLPNCLCFCCTTISTIWYNTKTGENTHLCQYLQHFLVSVNQHTHHHHFSDENIVILTFGSRSILARPWIHRYKWNDNTVTFIIDFIFMLKPLWIKFKIPFVTLIIILHVITYYHHLSTFMYKTDKK